MKVLVTGATGFVGRAIVRALSSSGHTVDFLSRDAERARERLEGARAGWSWNPLTQPAPAEAVRGAEAIVHLAGESVAGRWTEAKKRAIRESRLLGTQHLVAAIAAAEVRPAVLVSVSAIGYYGDRGDEVLAEDAGPGEGFIPGVCKEWEDAARGASALGVRVVILRLGIVLEKNGGALRTMLRPFRFGLGGPLGAGRQWWSWVHLDDVVGLVSHTLTSSASGVFNATSPEPVRQRAFAQALGGALGWPTVLPAPAFVVRLVLGEFSSEVLSSRRVVPRNTLAAGYSFRHVAVDTTLRSIVGT